MMKKFFKNNIFIFLFIFAGLMIVAVAVYTGVFISFLSDYFKESIDRRLRFISRSAAALVDVEELMELRTPEDIEKPLFGEMRRRLITFGENADVLYVYYVWPLSDGRYQIIVDNDTTKDSENLSTPSREAEAEFQDVLKGKTIVTGLGEYTSGPGDSGLLTAYAPIFDRDDNVIAAAGVDIPDEQILDIRNRI